LVLVFHWVKLIDFPEDSQLCVKNGCLFILTSLVCMSYTSRLETRIKEFMNKVRYT